MSALCTLLQTTTPLKYLQVIFKYLECYNSIHHVTKLVSKMKIMVMGVNKDAFLSHSPSFLLNLKKIIYISDLHTL